MSFEKKLVSVLGTSLCHATDSIVHKYAAIKDYLQCSFYFKFCCAVHLKKYHAIYSILSCEEMKSTTEMLCTSNITNNNNILVGKTVAFCY